MGGSPRNVGTSIAVKQAASIGRSMVKLAVIPDAPSAATAVRVSKHRASSPSTKIAPAMGALKAAARPALELRDRHRSRPKG
jgi:hypothetical protein